MNVRQVSVLLVASLVTAGAGTSAFGQSKAKKDPEKQANAAKPLRDLFQELDADGDRAISPDEVTDRGRDAFQTLLKYGDKDKDGKLTAEEYRGLTQDAAGAVPAVSPEQRKKRFAKLDANGDGKLDGKEIPGGDARIGHLDRDGDGSVSREEFLAVMPKRPGKVAGPKALAKKPEVSVKKPEAQEKGPDTTAKKPEEPAKGPDARVTARQRLAKRLMAMDKDGDMRVSREEFQGRPGAFARLDTNHDGFVDRADRRGKGGEAAIPGEAKTEKKPKAS